MKVKSDMTKPTTKRPASKRLFDRFVIWCANVLLGPQHYRVQFTYKTDAGQVVFQFTQTITVRDTYYINRHREIKVVRGEIYRIPSARPVLCNGTLEAEPTCFLGRWKDR